MLESLHNRKGHSQGIIEVCTSNIGRFDKKYSFGDFVFFVFFLPFAELEAALKRSATSSSTLNLHHA
jgi:hypothetical protein